MTTCRPALLGLGALLGLLLPAAFAQAPAASFTIRADWFDRGNVRTSTPGQDYADRYPCVWNGGPQPNQSEYELDFPVTADYVVVALYTAHDARPVDLYLDGTAVHRGFGGVTGSWQTSQARWERQVTLRIAAGRHTLKLLCPGPCMPHICALRFESPVPFPAAWRLARAAAKPDVPIPDDSLRPLRTPLLDLAAAGEAVRCEVVEAPLDEQLGPLGNNELRTAVAPAAGVASAWHLRLTREGADQPPQVETLPLSPARLRRMVAHILDLVADYRTQPGVARDFLRAEGEQAAALQAELARIPEPPADGAAWQRLGELYVAAYRLEKIVALRNPLLDFQRLLVVRRSVGSPALGLPQNWQGNCVLPRSGFDNEIAVLSPLGPAPALATLYRPRDPVFVGDVDLHADAGRLLFSSIGTHGRWQVFEINTDGSGLRQVTPGEYPDVDNYDPCYLPDERILFCSTADMVAVPCVNGSTNVANLCRMNADGTGIRQLCFDQEHNWCPTVLADGRVLYLRWEYTDTPHSHDRVLFTMNPDGTRQAEFYGSNSYWPNSSFYARPIPGSPTRFVSIVGGHHGVPRMGELVLFDVARGRREADGAVQRIPGRGRPVEPLIEDNLVDGSWPKFLHPFPLSDTYFLVAAQPGPGALWGIYLADVFDGLVLLAEDPGYALLEPVPLCPTPRPPVIPDTVDLGRRDAVVQISNVYAGGGLAGVPRGTVKRLRVLSYHFLYPGMGGPQGVVGMEGPWDIKRILGTVPVEADGSALFRVPANTPISVQPLDAEGRALQLMRSWFTGMPGETVSCVGCHEPQNSGPLPVRPSANAAVPAEITPWYGPPRGFAFQREVQPVLDRYCVSCHSPGAAGNRDGRLADLRGQEWIKDYTSLFHHGGRDAGHFTVAYSELHRWVRRPGMESDYHMLTPLEFHASTTELFQMLTRGHHNVRLDPEAWDRLTTWVDLNAPFHGTWTEIAGAERVQPLARRRREMLKLYGDLDDDPEAIPPPPPCDTTPVVPAPEEPIPGTGPALAGWPLAASEASRRQQALGTCRETLDLGEGVSLDLALVPAGEAVVGDPAGAADERPSVAVRIPQPFWLGRCEVTNAQFARFDPGHDSKVEHRHAMQFGVRGFYVNGPAQPAVRVSWLQAMAFCDWLSSKTGRRFTLPTEAQWEYACRAGAATAFSFGAVDSDFSRFANLGDTTLREFVCHPYRKEREPFPNPGPYDDWIPHDTRYSDGGFVSENVGRWEPNAWGLCDMHGNVWEWTRSAYRPYPYRDDDGRNDPAAADATRVVRGGSWYDRPALARAAVRLAYRPYQPVYNVGFRVLCEASVR